MTAAEAAPRLRVIHNDDCVAEAALDAPISGAIKATLFETQRLTFEVEPKEKETEYRIEIGDIAPQEAIGRTYRRHVEWPVDIYLESARGLVSIKLYSRTESGAPADWRLRTSLLVAVNSSKLTEGAFEAMVADLAALSSGLLFDLISKSSAGIGRKREAPAVRISPRSAQLELRCLEALVGEIGSILLDIARQPETAWRSERVIAAWTGSERLSNDGLSWFVARGVDPREAAVGHQLLGPRLQVVAESSSPEHGTIRWFLELLRERAAECAERARAERISLEADKPYRSRSNGTEPSLYESFDEPKIARLGEATVRAHRIARAISGMLSLPFLRRQRPIVPLEATPVFRYVLNYHRFWRAMREYLRRSVLLLEHNLDERSKPTWRMYEQWVFLQIVAAFEEIGLRPSSQDSLFRRLGAHLFTVDLRRGTRLGFAAADGRLVFLRYEPWIFARDLARRNGDAVFQGREGEAPWSPDVLIEVFEPTVKDKPPRLALGIVVDAKYSKRLEDRHWSDTGKYQMIRDTSSGAQIVRQVWIALPAESEDGNILTFMDKSVSWTAAGPDRPPSASEFLQGAVTMVPDPAAAPGTICPGARELARGMLAWLRFPEAADRQFHEKLATSL